MKKVIIASGLLLAIICVLVFLYFKQTGSLLSGARPTDAVPEDATLVIEFNNDTAFYDLYSKSPIVADLFGKSTIEDLSFLNTLFLNNSLVKKQFLTNKIVCSAHFMKANALGLLFIARIDNPSQLKEVNTIFRSFITPKNTLETRIFENTPIYDFHFKEADKTISFTIEKGLLIVSYSAFLVESAVRQLNTGKKITDNPQLKEISEKSSKSSLANVYINYKTFPKLFLPFLNKESAKSLDFMADAAQWSLLNLNYKSDAFMLNGLTSINDSVNEYLHLFLKQQAQQIEITNAISSRAAAVLSFGIEDYSIFKKDYHTLLARKGKIGDHEASIEYYNKKYGINLEEEYKRWIGNEFALIINEHSSGNLKDESLAIIKTPDTLAAASLLSRMSAIDKKAFPGFKFIETYKKFNIHFINIPDFLGLAIGPVFNDFMRPYCVMVDNYIVFANKPEVLKTYLEDYIGLQTLSKNEKYIAFENYISDQSNVYLFINKDNCLPLLKNYLGEDIMADIDSQSIRIDNFYGLAYQLSSNKTNFFTNFIVKYQTEVISSNELVWKLHLDAPVSMMPKVVINHSTGEKEIIVQDDDNMLYLISNRGKILWKLQLPEQILGEIHQVDYYKNDKLQYLFNTSRQLYLVDRNGSLMPSYPIRLSTKATCGLSIFDYEKDKNYRIFITCDNQAIFGYLINGQPIQGWNPKRNVGLIDHPIQYVNVKGKDYLMAITRPGDVFIFNRKAELICRGQESIKGQIKTPFTFIERSNNDSNYFIASTSKGFLKRIYLDGTVKSNVFGAWSSDHLFSYENVTGSPAKEFIYIDKKELYVYNSDTSLAFTYQFLYDINLPAQFFPAPSNGYYIGVTSVESNQLFMLNGDGKLLKGFPLKGSTPFTVTEFRQSGGKNIIAGSKDGYIYVYAINY